MSIKYKKTNKPLIGIICDEISDDIEKSFEICSENRFDYISLRSNHYENVFYWSNDLWLKVKNLSDKYRIPIISIASPFFKSSFNIENTFPNKVDFPLPILLDKNIINNFEKWLINAVKCNPKFVRIFSPLNYPNFENEYLDKWVVLLKKVLEIAKKYNIILAIENEPVCYFNTAVKVNSFVKEMNDSNLKFIWDPGNDLSQSSNVKKHIFSSYDNVIELHVKDWSIKGKEWVILGKGDLPLPKILLKNDNISYICLETHVSSSKDSKIKNSLESFFLLKNLFS